MKEINGSATIQIEREVNYLIHLPKNYDQDNKKHPLIIYFHGSGERGEDIKAIKKYGLLHYADKIDIPYIILSIQCQQNSIWDTHFAELEQLIQNICQQYRVAEDKIITLGISMGGFGALHFAMRRPDMIKGAISVAGGTIFKSNITNLKNTPVLLIHGEADDRADIGQSARVYNILAPLNKDVTFIRKGGAGHELCSTIFEEALIYNWLRERF